MISREQIRTALDDLWLAGWITRQEYQHMRFLLAKGSDARLSREALALQDIALSRMYADDLAS
jgi:hypothetical protein